MKLRSGNVFSVAAFMAVAMTLAAPAARAVTYNAVTDFLLNNPNGVWSYESADSPGPDHLLDVSTITHSGDVLSWTNGAVVGGAEASIHLNNGYTGYPTIPLHSDRLNLDPQSQAWVSLVFTAPTTGTYHGSETIYGDDIYETAHQVSLLVNGVPVGGGTISSYGQTASFSGNVFLEAGQQIAIVVDTNPEELQYLGTGVSANISLVPEPSVWALMLFGFGAVGATMRSRRRVAQAAV